MIRKAFYFSIKRLGIKKIPKLFFDYLEDLNGFYCREDNSITLNRKRSLEQIIKTLFHEMQHCKQFEMGWLKIIEEEIGIKCFWKKNKIKSNTKHILIGHLSFDPSDYFKEYFARPWEIQARHVSENLFKEFKQFYR